MYLDFDVVGTGFVHVLYFGRDPRTKGTLPDFHEKCRVTRHSLVFRGLTGSQRTPGKWGVTITFSDTDLEGCQHPNDDQLVIRAVVANKTVHRVLVYNGSLADIIFASEFDKMGIGREKLEPISAQLRGFSGEKVLPLGSVQLVLTLGDPPCQAITTTKFLIVEALSVYNMLLGRPSLNAIRAIPSAYHMVVKFPTKNGVGVVRGDQRIARECYLASMK